ncbi:MAG: exo-alpha-sialidase, partial [Deltaproteobacteria bacterium]|nr:exo-alpha-sialidase [Deltaproteobacteria bacterium]
MKNFRPLVYLAATLCTISLLTGPVAAETFGTDIRINDDSTEYGQYIGGEKTSVVLQENTLYAVWQDNRNYSSNYEEFQKADIYFSKSTVAADGMVTPGANILVNDIPGGANRDEESRPAMTVGVDGTIYIVWTDKRNIDNQLELNDIYFSKSTDGGLTFSANQPIGTTSGNSVQSAIAVAGTSVYIIFQHCCDPANDVINLVTSIDSGESFGDIATIVPAGGAEQPEVAAQGSSVYIAYRDRSSEFNGNVMLITSSNNGASFGAAQQLNSDTDASVQTEISLTATGSNVYAIWRDRRDNAMGVYLATSTDNGITFGNDQLVVPHSTDPATYPAISAYGDTLALGY